REFANRSPKPVVVTWNSYKTDEPGFGELVASGVPLFRSFRNCFRALRSYRDYTARASGFRDRPAWIATPPAAAERVFANSSGPLGPDDSRVVLEAFGIPVVAERVAATP